MYSAVMGNLRLRLMHREALQRIHDAEILDKAITFSEVSNSAYLLRLLGFELLLKCIYEVLLNKSPNKMHAYEKIFGGLPSQFQKDILALTSERIGPSMLTDNHEAVLKEWGKNFIAMRYPYEKYLGLTERDYSELGEQWVASGAPSDGAKFRYYPEELFGFLYALKIVTQDMANCSFQLPTCGGSN